MKLLVVEDEAKLSAYLRKGLTEEGFTVDVVHSGIEGLRIASQADYHLIVLDGMLPGIDGLTVLKTLRTKKQTPVLMLSARAQVEDRVHGLLSGADDYLVKPFAFAELVARIEALIRRSYPNGNREPRFLGVADLEMDLVRRRVVRAGECLDLTAKEFCLLSLFLRREGEVLSRNEIAEQVWDMPYDGEKNVIEVAIRRLRGKIDEPFTTPLLHTVRGVGYTLQLRDK